MITAIYLLQYEKSKNEPITVCVTNSKVIGDDWQMLGEEFVTQAVVLNGQIDIDYFDLNVDNKYDKLLFNNLKRINNMLKTYGTGVR